MSNNYINELNKLNEKFSYYKNMNLSLNMARGVPCKEQINLSMKMMDVLNSDSDFICEDNIDCRTYGGLIGIPECRKLLADIIEVNEENIIIFGNSSLNVMFDCISHAYTKGVMGNIPWSKLDKIKWLCPVPGYDRHFAILEYFGIEMINIPMNNEGPDMDLVEKLVSEDESIKGIWCVPKYSNPSGITYSDEVVRRFAALKAKAKDFRIYWDNAYSVHHLYEDKQDVILEILDEAKKAHNDDIVYKFTSTSKISFPGSGIAALATSDNNLKDILEFLKYQTIGHDKVNQLRHVRFFKNLDGVKKQMIEHAKILRPKFKMVDDVLHENGMEDYATWTKPLGGYFISYDTKYPIAKEVIAMCASIGLKLTPAGSSFPYHCDPNNTNIRIAPTNPSLDELKIASEILSIVTKKLSIEYLMRLEK